MTPPRWTGAFTDFFDRRVDRAAGSPERAVQVTDAWVARAQRRYGPDSWKTVNTLEAAAKRRDAAGDHEGALARCWPSAVSTSGPSTARP